MSQGIFQIYHRNFPFFCLTVLVFRFLHSVSFGSTFDDISTLALSSNQIDRTIIDAENPSRSIEEFPNQQAKLNSKARYFFFGGGYDPIGAQVSIERNGHLFLNKIEQLRVDPKSVQIFFGGGNDSNILDVAQIIEELPVTHKILAKIMGDFRTEHHVEFRHHNLSNVNGPSKIKDIQRGLSKITQGKKPIRIYYSGHGSPGGRTLF